MFIVHLLGRPPQEPSVDQSQSKGNAKVKSKYPVPCSSHCGPFFIMRLQYSTHTKISQRYFAYSVRSPSSSHPWLPFARVLLVCCEGLPLLSYKILPAFTSRWMNFGVWWCRCVSPGASDSHTRSVQRYLSVSLVSVLLPEARPNR